jgi:two-component system, LuxR family, sensor kinase FixL
MSQITPAHPDDDFLARRYLAALAMVAVLILIDQVVIQPSLFQLTSDAPVINVAGRQGMLSQRLAKLALELDRSNTEPERIPLLSELALTLESWTMAHDGLRSGDEGRSLPSQKSETIEAALQKIDPLYYNMSGAANRLVRDRADSNQRRIDLEAILESEKKYLFQMERIVALYESEARERVVELRRTGWVVTTLILVSLLGVGLFILRPAAQLIRRQFAQLREARDALEVRVAARTIELEQANSDLQREVEERSRAEARHHELLQQFSQVNRTTTVGEMATGLAHELNQPLGAVANYIEGCLVALDGPKPMIEEIKAALGKALGATLRTGEIIKRIRRFVNRHPSEHELFSPNRVVEEVEALLRQEAKSLGITLRLDLALELPRIIGDPVQVQQVLVNLVRNATESLSISRPTSPTVVLETRIDESGDVEFRVTDNGEGIAADRLEQVFDPFFSTRAEGMGMGLAISRTLVESHHGRLVVESELGVRTIFRFNLPVTAPF